MYRIISLALLIFLISFLTFFYSSFTGFFSKTPTENIPASEQPEKEIGLPKENVTVEQKVEEKKEEVPKCPESCDDNNPCTKDFCDETTGYLCKHSNLNGDVGGCSELIDVCIKATCIYGKCAAIKVDNCCGNNICEARETCESCPTDCECPAHQEGEGLPEEDNVAEHIVISEVYYDTLNETCSEFVELYNPLNQDIDISGWIIATSKSSKDAIIPENSFVPAHSFYLIGDRCWSEGRDNPEWSDADHNETITLSNKNGWVILKDSSENLIDRLGWGDAVNYEGNPAIDVTEGHSLERKPGYENPSGGNGIDTDNNANDFLDRETPEPQNSSSLEIPS
jgi:hypothetical protein